jgi:hypothetical protein
VKNKSNWSALVTIAVMFVASAARGSVTIDKFEDTEGPLTAGLYQGEVFLTSVFQHVVGGRGISISNTTTGVGFPGSNPISAEIINRNGASFFEYRSSDDGASGECQLGYGGSSTIEPAPQPMGLYVNPATDFLRLTFIAYNHANALDMTVDALLNTELLHNPSDPPVVGALTIPGAQVLDFPLTSLVGNVLNFVTFDFHAPPGANFQLSSVQLANSVPEPTAAGLLCLSTLLLLPRRKIARH